MARGTMKERNKTRELIYGSGRRAGAPPGNRQELRLFSRGFLCTRAHALSYQHEIDRHAIFPYERVALREGFKRG